MNRCTIIQFYEPSAAVDDYIWGLIKQLKTVSNTVIVVSNTPIRQPDIVLLHTIVDKIILRDNEGCDAGAYRDVILYYLGQEALSQYDEVILCNTTFFGFFKPLSEIFLEMETKTCDYWGIGYMNSGIFSYVQAYFLVLRAPVVQKALYTFFQDVLQKTIQGRNESGVYYEYGIHRYLQSCGFTHGAYIEKPKYYMFGCSALSVIQDGYPLCKKKAFSPEFYDENTIKCLLKHIRTNTTYPVDWIIDTVNRSYSLNIDSEDIDQWTIDVLQVDPIVLGCSSLSYEDVRYKLVEFENVYLFGIGIYSMLFLETMKDALHNLKGFLVSDGQKEQLQYTPYIRDVIVQEGDEVYFRGLPVLENRLLDDKENVLVVVAMDLKNSRKVQPKLSYLPNVQYLWDEMTNDINQRLHNTD